ncbi:MAG: hypothetical protein IJB00_03990 [Akkermansia sp.]|nr:hypothetical protein [Akkermansia sp.]
MIKFTFTMLALFPLCSTNLCAAAFDTFPGNVAAIRGFVKAARTAKRAAIIKREKEKQQEQERERERRRNNNNRNYNPYGY